MRRVLQYGVIGMGPVGAVIAAHLAHGGQRVTIMDIDSARVDALLAQPLVVTGALKVRARLTSGAHDLEELVAARPDVVFVATKNCDSPAILADLKRLGLREDAVIVASQNGFDVEEQAIGLFGSSRALSMVLNLGAGFVGSNEVKVGFCFSHVLSFRKDVDESTTRAIHDDLNSSGFATELREDYRVAAFRKAVLNSSVGSVCALTGMTIKDVMVDPELSRIVKQIIREGICIGQAMGFGLRSEFLDEAVAYLSKGGDHKPSILKDIEGGRRTENAYLCDRLFDLAQRHGVDVPVMQTLFYLVKNRELAAIKEKGARKKT